MDDGKKKKFLDPGLLFLFVGLLYLIGAGYLLTHSDWNPRTPNYLQFLVNTGGGYTGGIPFDEGYAFVAVLDDNTSRFVVTDAHGDVRSAYDLSPVPANVFARDDGLYFVFVEGNRLQLLRYSKGEFHTVVTLSSKWKFQPLHPPRISTSPKFFLFAKHGSFEGPVIVDLEENVHDPRLTAYFCNNCRLSPERLLSDGSIFGDYRGDPVIIRLNGSKATVLILDTNLALSVTDICGDFFVGRNANSHLVFGSLRGDTIYELNVPTSSPPICHGRKILFSSPTGFTGVDIGSELNNYRVYTTYSEFEPLGVFEDAPYIVFYGESSGNPSVLQNILTEMKCPEAPQNLGSDFQLRPLPFRAARMNLFTNTSLLGYPAEPFAVTQKVTVDEDFRCYRP